MTRHQARRERREAERKAKKAEQKRLRASEHERLASAPTLEEFSPELIAEANAARERVHRRIGLTPPNGLVPQNPARAEVNRSNARHSTGPKSPEGKLASCRNSLKHGLASGEIIIRGKDPAAFEALLHNLLEEQQPASATEELLIHQMAQSYWLTQRALRLQNECFGENGVDEKRLALFLRYQTTHDRAFHKALATLRSLRMGRACPARGFVPQDRSNRAAHGAPSEPDGLSETGFVSQNHTDSLSTDQFVRQNGSPM